MIFHASCPHCGGVYQTRELIAHALTCGKKKENAMTEKVQVKFKKLTPAAATPERKTGGAAGWDLRTVGGWVVGNWVAKVDTGITVEIPPGYEGQLRLRSSLGVLGVLLANGVGTIDSDYRGTIQVLLHKPVGARIEIPHGDRIAQLVIHKLPDVEFVEVSELSATVRGAGGFGSTNG